MNKIPTCNTCKTEKDISLMITIKGKSNGICKECQNAKCRQYYQKNKEQKLQKTRAYYHEHKERYAQLWNEWYADAKKNNLNWVIKQKIKNYKMLDAKFNRLFIDEDYVDIIWVNGMLNDLSNKCWWCNKPLELTGFEKYSANQFSIDRLDNTKAHTKDNCVIACLECNHRQH
jgi:hypothetical protein